jgi:hypothetical protein
MSIEKFALDIQTYGSGLRLSAVVGNTETIIVPSMIKLIEVLKGESLRDYLQKIVADLKPKKLIAEVGRPNGTAFTNKKVFEYTITDADMVKKSESEAVTVPDPFRNLTLSGPEAGSNPMVGFYQIQLQTANSELARKNTKIDSLTAERDTLKDKCADLKRDLDTVEQKFALEREKDRVAGENTALSVIRELKPELQGLMGMIGDKMGVKNQALNAPPATQQDDTPSISSVITGYLSQMSAAPGKLSFAFELFIRAFNMTPEDQQLILELMREKTDSITEALNTQLNQLVKK